MLPQAGEGVEQPELSPVTDKSGNWGFVKPLTLLILNYFDYKTHTFLRFKLTQSLKMNIHIVYDTVVIHSGINAM